MASEKIEKQKYFKVGTGGQVTLPYTAQNDGLVIIEIRAQAQGRCYANFSGHSELFTDAYQVKDGYFSKVVPVLKGTTIPVPTLNNVSAYTIYWFEFN